MRHSASEVSFVTSNRKGSREECAGDTNAQDLWTESHFDLPSQHRLVHAHKRGTSEMGADIGFHDNTYSIPIY